MKQVVSYQPFARSEDYDLRIVGRSEHAMFSNSSSHWHHRTHCTHHRRKRQPARNWVARRFYHQAAAVTTFLAVNSRRYENLLESELFATKKAHSLAPRHTHRQVRAMRQRTIFSMKSGHVAATQTKFARAAMACSSAVVAPAHSSECPCNCGHEQPLEQVVATKQFPKIFYRLNVVPFQIPPLRERRRYPPVDKLFSEKIR